MCTFDKPTKMKSFTEYKVAARRNADGRYFSLATGMEYKPGPVSAPKKQNRLCSYFAGDLLNPDGMAYERRYAGRTAVFDDWTAAERKATRLSFEGVRRGYTLVVLKMTITAKSRKPIWDGEYTGYPVKIGPDIESLEEVRK